VDGCSDASYAPDPDNRKSVSASDVFLCGAPVVMKSQGQKIVTLSSTEAELVAAVNCAQDMLYVMRILESIGLKVKKPMVLWVDNKGTVDLANNWSVGGRTRHVEVRMYFLRDLKEEGTLITRWIPGADNPADLFSKNLPYPLFQKHVKKFCGEDEYQHG
jgi:hypothetical protein